MSDKSTAVIYIHTDRAFKTRLVRHLQTLPERSKLGEWCKEAIVDKMVMEGEQDKRHD